MNRTWNKHLFFYIMPISFVLFYFANELWEEIVLAGYIEMLARDKAAEEMR